MATRTPTIAQTVGRNIKAARLEAGYSQNRLAPILGVFPKDISRWENGHVEPIAHRKRLADFFFEGDVAELYRDGR